MSDPASNPFFETDFSKLMNLPKIMGEFKTPGIDVGAIMDTCRRNMETFVAINQATFEAMQNISRRQADWFRRSFEEATEGMNAIMSSPTPEEKVLLQAGASKAAIDKCMTNARDIAETFSQCNVRTMETVSKRMAESFEELRGMVKNGKTAA